MNDELYMQRAIELAKKGTGFVNPNPLVGAVIVKDDIIIGEGYHEKYGELHAERNALKNCSESPEGATIYVTLEPCQMCAGAIVQARIPKVVMAAENPKAGCAGSVMDILNNPEFNHQVEVQKGVLKEECSRLLKEFFVELRARNKAEKEQKGAL